MAPDPPHWVEVHVSDYESDTLGWVKGARACPTTGELGLCSPQFTWTPHDTGSMTFTEDRPPVRTERAIFGDHENDLFRPNRRITESNTDVP